MTEVKHPKQGKKKQFILKYKIQLKYIALYREKNKQTFIKYKFKKIKNVREIKADLKREKSAGNERGIKKHADMKINIIKNQSKN